MQLDKYSVVSKFDHTTFEFESEGQKGKIVKLVQFSDIEPGIANLAFGDKCPITGKLDDQIVSNNGDREKVLATVASCALAFSDQYPGVSIFVKGSSTSRTRLYQMGISRFREEIELDFEIYGFHEKKWRPFVPNINFEAFLVRRRVVKW